ncbi:bifunctional pyrazinamidase/nicotinamidase [Microbacterium album]|uniref:nicotinamidase n=1 Tax=Microbacterium album TaxID=2053191 RepID=A0A917IF81_9MICO|nr:bifunctional pyrazinamidase/nicotinamidase [Microbacterium album]
MDVQNDFTEGGALGVDGGGAVAAGITRLLAEHAHEYAAIVASRDWHDPDGDNGGHFAYWGDGGQGEPDYVDSWPPHCIAGTEGAEYDPALDTTAVTHHVKKGQGRPAYSMFEGVTDDGSTVAAVLAERGIESVDVVGIATDHCVRASALDAIAQGQRVRLFTDLIAGVAPEPSEAALAEIVHAGGELAESGNASA